MKPVYAEPLPSSPQRGRASVGAGASHRLQRSAGRAAVAFRLGSGGRTVLADLHQSAPCRALLPLSEDLPTAVYATTCGGLTGGDHVRFDLRVEAGAAARATTQAAERVYRARVADGPARVGNTVHVGEGAYAEWLPQETILFDGARLARRTVFDLVADASVLACELRVLGRAAHGETFGQGFLADRIEVRRAGKLEWVDALRLGSDHQIASPATRSGSRGLEGTGTTRPRIAQGASGGAERAGAVLQGLSGDRQVIGRALASPAGFGGHPAVATVFYAAPGAPDSLAAARDILGDREAVKAAATAWDNILVARFLAPDVFLLRRAVARFAAAFRAHLGRAPVMPRFWSL